MGGLRRILKSRPEEVMSLDIVKISTFLIDSLKNPRSSLVREALELIQDLFTSTTLQKELLVHLSWSKLVPLILQKGINDKKFIAEHAVSALDCFGLHYSTEYRLILSQTENKNAKIAALAFNTLKRCLLTMGASGLEVVRPTHDVVKACVRGCLKGKLATIREDAKACIGVMASAVGGYVAFESAYGAPIGKIGAREMSEAMSHMAPNPNAPTTVPPAGLKEAGSAKSATKARRRGSLGRPKTSKVPIQRVAPRPPPVGLILSDGGPDATKRYLQDDPNSEPRIKSEVGELSQSLAGKDRAAFEDRDRSMGVEELEAPRKRPQTQRREAAARIQSGLVGAAARQNLGIRAEETLVGAARLIQGAVLGCASRGQAESEMTRVRLEAVQSIQGALIATHTRVHVSARLAAEQRTQRLSELSKLLRSDISTVRDAAASQIAELNRQSGSESTVSPKQRHRALKATWHAEETDTKLDKLDRVVSMLRNPNWTVRLAALSSLKQAGPTASGHMEEASKLLQDPHPRVQDAARATLRVLAPPETGEVYIDRFWAPRPVEAYQPDESIAASESSFAKPTPSSVLTDLKDTRFAVRRTAVVALGDLIRDNAQAAGFYCQAAIERLQDPHIAVRQAAADVLMSLGDSATNNVVQAVVDKMQQHSDARVRRMCVKVLGDMGRQARQHLTDVEKLRKDPDYGVNRAAETTAERLRGTNTFHPRGLGLKF